MENFVFPDEIKSELMRMIKLVNIFYVPFKIMRNHRKLYFFLLAYVSLQKLQVQPQFEEWEAT